MQGMWRRERKPVHHNESRHEPGEIFEEPPCVLYKHEYFERMGQEVEGEQAQCMLDGIGRDPRCECTAYYHLAKSMDGHGAVVLMEEASRRLCKLSMKQLNVSSQRRDVAELWNMSGVEEGFSLEEGNWHGLGREIHAHVIALQRLS